MNDKNVRYSIVGLGVLVIVGLVLYVTGLYEYIKQWLKKLPPFMANLWAWIKRKHAEYKMWLGNPFKPRIHVVVSKPAGGI